MAGPKKVTSSEQPPQGQTCSVVNFPPASGAARFEQFGEEARPAGLMGGAEAAARVPIEVFEEEEMLPKVGIARPFGVGLHGG